jgi:hypothetical protein
MKARPQRVSLFEAVPLLILPLAAFGGLYFFYEPAALSAALGQSLAEILPMAWVPPVSIGMIAVMLSTALLAWEILRAAYDHAISLKNHVFSALLFISAIVLAVKMEFFQNEVFLFLILLSGFDVFVGVYVTIKTRSRVVTSAKEVIHITADIKPKA